MASSNPLSSKSLCNIIAQALPKDSTPQLKGPYDAIAIAVHASLLAVGFRLIGLNEDERLPPSTSGSVDTLPAEWSAHSPSSFSFVYAHTQSAMQFVVRINRMGTKAVITAMAIGDDKPITFSATADDYISASSLPASPVAADVLPTPSTDTPASHTPAQLELPESVLRSIQDIFISAGRLSDLGNLVRTQLIQKLVPSLQKQGYDGSTTTAEESTRAQRPAPPANPPQPDRDPLALPRPGINNPRPYPTGEMPPPGWDDEYDILRPPRPLGDYGRSDLYPAGLGPNDPFNPMGPYAPPGGTGGMHPSFDDPLFRGQGRGRGRAPPGARWDPTGPPGMGGGGFGGNPFGGYGDGDFI